MTGWPSREETLHGGQKVAKHWSHKEAALESSNSISTLSSISRMYLLRLGGTHIQAGSSHYPNEELHKPTSGLFGNLVITYSETQYQILNPSIWHSRSSHFWKVLPMITWTLDTSHNNIMLYEPIIFIYEFGIWWASKCKYSCFLKYL